MLSWLFPAGFRALVILLLWFLPAIIVAFDPNGFPGSFLPTDCDLWLYCLVAFRLDPTMVKPSSSSTGDVVIVKLDHPFIACARKDLVFAIAACLTIQDRD